MSDELGRFKREINLIEYANDKGWLIDKHKSSRRSIIMRRGDEKIGIGINKRTGDQNFNHFDQKKGGTVIDFCQFMTGKNLGRVRQELRQYLNGPKIKSHARPISPPTPQEQTRSLEKEKMNAVPLEDISYLQSRGISKEIIKDPRFKNKIFQDKRGNTCFPHVNENGFSGFEKKNVNFTGFSANGEKGVWFSHEPAKCNRIVFCESAVDTISYALIRRDPRAAYVSLGGQLSKEQESLIKAIMDRNRDRTIVLAFDNDEAGSKYTLDRLLQNVNLINFNTT